MTAVKTYLHDLDDLVEIVLPTSENKSSLPSSPSNVILVLKRAAFNLLTSINRSFCFLKVPSISSKRSIKIVLCNKSAGSTSPTLKQNCQKNKKINANSPIISGLWCCLATCTASS